MAIIGLFDSASSVMTVISLLTFLGILWWTFGIKRSADFDAAAAVPFADDTEAEMRACRSVARETRVRIEQQNQQQQQTREQDHV
jgi:cytochrome c oxidase cbb3-type subunit 4